MTYQVPPETPAWLNELSTHEIAQILENPGRDLSGNLAKRLLGKTPIYQAQWTSMLDETQPPWLLPPSDIQALEYLRYRLDTWWSERSPAMQEALLTNRAGMVPGVYRDDVEAFGPEAKVIVDEDDARRDLRRPFKLPKLIHGYVRLNAPGNQQRR